MQVKYNSWDQVPIKVYKEIQAVMEDDGLQGMDKDVAIIAILCDVPDEEIWNLPIGELGVLSRSLQWVNDFKFDQEVKFRKVKVGKFECRVIDSIADFTVAGYIDFNNLWRAEKRDISALLTTFLVPVGKDITYNKGYSIQELYSAIDENMPITTANALCFFFLKSLRTLTQDMLIYLDYILEKEAKRKKTDPAVKEKLMEAIQTLRSFGSVL